MGRTATAWQREWNTQRATRGAVRLKRGEVSSAAQTKAEGNGSALRGERVVELLAEWRPAVLAQMRTTRLWWDAPAAEHEDQYQDVSLALYARPFESEEH